MSSEANERLYGLRAAAAVARWVRQEVGLQELLVLTGLVLLGAGLWQVSPAAGLAVPGAVLVWAALPQRPPFVTPPRRGNRREDY